QITQSSDLRPMTVRKEAQNHSRQIRLSVTPYHRSFSAWASAHRDLHSFPTRRSSDLAQGARATYHFELTAPGGRRTGTRPAPARSEEHTSELQSRENLVCRLLLEKKNNKMKHK